MTTFLLLTAVVSVAVAAIAGVMVVSIFAKSSLEPTALIIGVAGTAIPALIAILRGEIERGEGKQDRQEIKEGVEKTRQTTETVAQRTDVMASAVQTAAIRAGEAAKQSQRIQQELKDGILATVADTNAHVKELKQGAVPAEVVDKVADQVRAAEREQAVEGLLNCPHLQGLLGRVAAAAVEQYVRRAKEPPQ